MAHRLHPSLECLCQTLNNCIVGDLPFGTLGKVSELIVIKRIRCLFAEFFEEAVSGLKFRERNIDSSFETSPDGRVEIPR